MFGSLPKGCHPKASPGAADGPRRLAAGKRGRSA
jgi:hypothetical protein